MADRPAPKCVAISPGEVAEPNVVRTADPTRLCVSTDDLIGLAHRRKPKKQELSLKLVRRMKRIETLPPGQQKVLLQTIDNFLKGVGK